MKEAPVNITPAATIEKAGDEAGLVGATVAPSTGTKVWFEAAQQGPAIDLK